MYIMGLVPLHMVELTYKFIDLLLIFLTVIENSSFNVSPTFYNGLPTLSKTLRRRVTSNFKGEKNVESGFVRGKYYRNKDTFELTHRLI